MISTCVSEIGIGFDLELIECPDANADERKAQHNNNETLAESKTKNLGDHGIILSIAAEEHSPGHNHMIAGP